VWHRARSAQGHALRVLRLRYTMPARLVCAWNLFLLLVVRVYIWVSKSEPCHHLVIKGFHLRLTIQRRRHPRAPRLEPAEHGRTRF